MINKIRIEVNSIEQKKYQARTEEVTTERLQRCARDRWKICNNRVEGKKGKSSDLPKEKRKERQNTKTRKAEVWEFHPVVTPLFFESSTTP